MIVGSTMVLVLLWVIILALADIDVSRKHYATLKDIDEVNNTSLPGDLKFKRDQRKKSLTLKEDVEI